MEADYLSLLNLIL